MVIWGSERGQHTCAPKCFCFCFVSVFVSSLFLRYYFSVWYFPCSPLVKFFVVLVVCLCLVCCFSSVFRRVNLQRCVLFPICCFTFPLLDHCTLLTSTFPLGSLPSFIRHDPLYRVFTALILCTSLSLPPLHPFPGLLCHRLPRPLCQSTSVGLHRELTGPLTHLLFGLEFQNDVLDGFVNFLTSSKLDTLFLFKQSNGHT